MIEEVLVASVIDIEVLLENKIAIYLLSTNHLFPLLQTKIPTQKEDDNQKIKSADVAHFPKL